jgi:alcohol dehydrogenase class IV
MNALCLLPGLRFAAGQAPDAVARFEASIGGVPVEELARLDGFERLRDFGVPEADLPDVAAAAAARAGNQNMPRPATPDEIEQLLRSIYG